MLASRKIIHGGIKPITSRPHHPQTCGKNERGHQTLQRWLAARPAAATLVELLALLDRYSPPACTDAKRLPSQGRPQADH